MAVYAIGDVQGCDVELDVLLKRLRFRSDRDRLWFVGDIVNRGPRSLSALRRVHALRDNAVVVLGNHDLHLLAVAYSRTRRLRDGDTLDAVLQARDRDRLLDWLIARPLFHYDADLEIAMVHAGLPPQWDLRLARSAAAEVHKALRRNPGRLFARMYGNRAGSVERFAVRLRSPALHRQLFHALALLRCQGPHQSQAEGRAGRRA